MKFRAFLVASAIGLLSAAQPLRAADLASDAKAFGARDAVIAPDLSADGSQVVYITPATGRKSVAVKGNLDTGQFSTGASSDGDPEILRWCHLVPSTRSVRQITRTVKHDLFELRGLSRLVSLSYDGSDATLLG